MFTRILFFCMLFPMLAVSRGNYPEYFTENAMRFDFLLSGNDEHVKVYPVQMKMEPRWAGSKSNLIDPFHYGTYRFRVFDVKSDSLIFSKGFSTLFQEWQTTPEAKNIEKAFYQAVIFPYPKQKIRLKIDARRRKGSFETIFTTEIDPVNYFILKEKTANFKTVEILKNGDPENKVDIVILAEGYTDGEMDKFVHDAGRVTGYLFDEEPFRSQKDKFNVTAVLTPSFESGTDIPGENIYVNTRFNASFYTFDLPRYLSTTDMKSIYDAAAAVPYDQIYLLVNSDRYGGGGFYNLLTVCTANHKLTKEVLVHEFGHGFAGLGDEYYNSSVAYENFYDLETEPWEPNLTTLVHFETKWKEMVSASTPVPTPRDPDYKNTVGVYEGGGYMTKGIYSPFIDCRMKSNEAREFCPVCKKAIQKMIDYYTE